MNNKYALLFVLTISILVCFHGDWGGYLLGTRNIARNQGAIFLLLMTVYWGFVVLINKKSLRLNFPHKKIFLFFILNLFIICFFRPDIVEALRNFTAIILGYGIIIFLSSLLHSMSLRKALFITTFSLFVILCLSACVHITKVGNIIFFDRSNFAYRLGGIFSCGSFGILAGLNALLSLIGYQITERKTGKILYLIGFVTMIIFTLATDLRNIM